MNYTTSYYTNYGQWEQPPFSHSFWINWYDEDIVREKGLPKLEGKLIMLNGHTLISKKDLQTLKYVLTKNIEMKNQDFFDNIKKISLQITEEHLTLQTELEECTTVNKELYEKTITSMKRMMVPWFLSVIFSDDMGEILIKQAEKLNIPPSQIIDYIPQQETIMLQENKDAFKIKQQGGDIAKHVKQYEWIGTHHFWGEPITEEKFLKDLENVTEPQHTFKEAPAELKFSTEIAGMFQYLRQYPVEVFAIIAYKARPLFTAIAESWDMTYNDFIYYTADEVLKHLQNNTIPNKELIEKRKENCCAILENGEEKLITGDLTAWYDEFVPKADNLTKLTGIIANKGKATGKAKIFLIPEDMDKMQSGDILVTTMTTPDFIPLMKKAAAIVTDVGGLLSHASIVSRELGKPCIIGTKHATTSFKDNDTLEVDAEKGIVKKI